MKRYIIDIDGTICETNGNDYKNSVPIPARIAYFNELYEQGNEVIYWTARGMRSFEGNVNKCYDVYYELTHQQLNKWGVKHSQLWLGKPVYDIFIDDKAFNAYEVGRW